MSEGKQRKTKKKQSHKCVFCEEPVNDDDYCYGCHEYICSKCDETEVIGDHKVGDHRW